MVCTETILGKIVEKIVDTVFQSVGRHVGFLLHYKQNMKNLEDEVKINLQEQRTNVEGKINEANRRGEIIDNDVSVWLKNADETRQGVDKFMDDKAVQENMLCFNFSFPNFISRYSLSKEAEKEVVRVKHLTEKGGNIGTVSHPREDPPEVVFRFGGNYECFHSRDKVFKDIVKALKDPEVNMIGVYGTGGVGKTTMVTKVAEEVKKDRTFDEVIIAVVSQDANVIKIQEQLAARLKLPLSKETDDDQVGRASRLWNRLDNGMKNLIILDDVWHELDLKEIGIPIIDRNKSCKVVLTSRNRNAWKNMDVEEFAIEILSKEESWALFKKKVGNHVDAHEFRKTAWEVCEECQGLPVAINAIGAALKGKDMYAWRDALDKLKNSMLKDIEGIDQKVYASLKWSYDQLDSEDAKSCFLLCCLFPEDAIIPIDDLVRYYMAQKNIRRDKKPDTLELAYNRVHTVVGTLQSCLLLDVENYYVEGDAVKMHDVVRDVAISIANDEKSFLVKHGVKDWPEKSTYEQCSVISLRPRDMHEFPNELVCPALHTLRLDCTDDESKLQVPDRFFSGTENLVVLDLNSVTMSPILPASLAKLAKLQMLCLDRCKLGDIAILKDLKDHLEILSLRRSNIKVLPQEVGELTRLRLLDMDGCEELEVIPKGVISKLLCLEELYMPGWFSQWEGTTADGTGSDISCVSLDELMSLTRLTTLYVCIPDPSLLPKDFTFENLVRFNIAVGGLGYSSYIKNSTGVLHLENIDLANPLEGLLGKPNRCRERIGLYLSKSFSHLTDLTVGDCSCKYLFSPSSARGLVRLKTLFIWRCMDLEGVIGNEGEEDHEDIIPISFSLLNELWLTDLPNLKSFYPKKEKKATSSESCSAHDAQTVLFNDKVAFPALKRMGINSLLEITEIWDKQIFPIPEKETELSFCHLEYMRIVCCDKLMNVVGGCPRIEATVTEKQKGEEVDDYFTCFPKLMTLELQSLLSLKSFCSRSIQCEEQPLFDHQLAFPKLKDLRLDTLGEISTVVSPRLFGRLRNVDLLRVESCIGVTEVFHFDGLEVGEGQECVGSLIQVRKIQLNTLPKLTCLWNNDPHGLLGLQNLEYLTIKYCPLLRNLLTASVSKSLGGLKALYLMSCSTMEEVIATDEGHEEVIDGQEIVFPKLEWLILKDLSNLKSFCSANYNFNLPSLQRVVVKRCPNMQTFTSGSVRMPPTMFIARGYNDGPVIEDLNKHLEQQHSKGDQETIQENDMYGVEDRFSNL